MLQRPLDVVVIVVGTCGQQLVLDERGLSSLFTRQELVLDTFVVGACGQQQLVLDSSKRGLSRASHVEGSFAFRLLLVLDVVIHKGGPTVQLSLRDEEKLVLDAMIQKGGPTVQLSLRDEEKLFSSFFFFSQGPDKGPLLSAQEEETR